MDLTMIFTHDAGDDAGMYFGNLKSMDASFSGRAGGRLTWEDSNVIRYYERRRDGKDGKRHDGMICLQLFGLMLDGMPFPDGILAGGPVMRIDRMETEPDDPLKADSEYNPELHFLLTEFSEKGGSGPAMQVVASPGPDFRMSVCGGVSRRHVNFI